MVLIFPDAAFSHGAYASYGIHLPHHTQYVHIHLQNKQVLNEF